ncbi:hypothetical protein BDF21DRAFT_41275 [Thamnidium elegans]|nr:hypothetical protein BDF21DRAFT_41275 [Thamnidium elegans]
MVMRYFNGNRYMTEFIKKYQSMDKKYMHQLLDGSYLEERLFKFGLTCTHEHLCHSFIFDPDDSTYVQNNVFSEDQIDELKSINPVTFPEIDDDTVSYLMQFANVTTAEDLRKALYQNSDYNMNYNKDQHQIKDWIRHSLDHLLLVYESIDDFSIEHSEQWHQSRIWLPLELLFERISGSKSLRGESCSLSSCERKNLQRTVPSTDKLQTKKMGTRVDMLVTVNNLEFLCEEDKANDDNTKIIEERHFKIGKEMKDILWALFRRCDYNRTKMKNIVSLGIATFKFKAFFDVCDFKLGYVARITRSSEFLVPSHISELSKLLPILSMMLVFRLMILENIEIITETPSEPDIRSSLKRPHSPKKDDGFISSIKRNVNATTPDDITNNSRFKSIFKKGKDKK